MIRVSAAACLGLLMSPVALAARPAPPAVLHYESEDKLVFLPVRPRTTIPRWAWKSCAASP